MSHGSSPTEAAECGPGRQLWPGMRVGVTAYYDTFCKGPRIRKINPNE
jgi:hypothetical protein